MDPSIAIAFLLKYKVELIATALLSFQGWLGKTDRVSACNYLDLAINILTYVRDFFKKKEEAPKK